MPRVSDSDLRGLQLTLCRETRDRDINWHENGRTYSITVYDLVADLAHAKKVLEVKQSCEVLVAETAAHSALDTKVPEHLREHMPYRTYSVFEALAKLLGVQEDQVAQCIDQAIFTAQAEYNIRLKALIPQLASEFAKETQEHDEGIPKQSGAGAEEAGAECADDSGGDGPVS